MNRSRLNSTVRVLGAGVITCGLWAGCSSSGAKKPLAADASAPVAAAAAPTHFWGDFSEATDPKIAGHKVVMNLLARSVIEARNYGVIYPEVCVSYGSLRFAGQTHDADLLAQLVTRYQGMLNPPGERSPFPHNAAGGGGGARAGGRGRGAGRSGAATGPATQAAVADAAATQPAGGRRGGNRGGAGAGGGAGAPQGVDPKTATALTMVPQADHVDASVFGLLPMEIFRQTGDARYLAIGKKSADDQWSYRPDTSRMNPQDKAMTEAAIAAGLTAQSRWWIDDMFMIAALQSEAHRVTHEQVYVDRCATQMSAYLDKLQQPNGLFHHADDVPAYWGRGCGWVAVGLTELLTEMPDSHPLRPRIMDGYKKMMAALLKYQGADGMWKQLIDHEDSWSETSGSGMFTFAMATGVKKGWLPAAEYKEPARKSWIALCGYLDETGRVREVCVGTNKYPNMANAPDGMVAYYNNRGRNVGDLHGQSAFIWASWAMLD